MPVGAELEIYPVGVVYRLLRDARAYELRQVAAHVAAQAEFSVGERARSGKARGYPAVWPAIRAHAALPLRTAALFHGQSFFDYGHALAAAAAQHFQRREYPGGASAYDDDVGLHKNPPYGAMIAPFPGESAQKKAAPKGGPQNISTAF